MGIFPLCVDLNSRATTIYGVETAVARKRYCRFATLGANHFEKKRLALFLLHRQGVKQ